MKIERLTDRAREALVSAQAATQHCRHATVEAPHLLLGILRRPDSKGGAALDHAGLRYRDVLIEVEGMYEQTPEEAPGELLSLSVESMEAQQLAQPRESHVRLDALNRASDHRMQRAQLKRELIRGRVSLRSILLEPPECIQSARVFDMLLAIPRCGRVKATKILWQCSISTNATVAELSPGQHERLINLL